MTSSVIEPGQIIAGRYLIERWLGQGAMGSVYRALQLSVGRPVALKVLVDDPGGAAHYLARFEREALALSRLTHPNTVRLFDFGSLEPGRPFIVMELLCGSDLADDLARQGPLRWDQALRVLRQVGCSLAEAHAVGIVHRDIKPANIFLCAAAEWPRVKLLDFGIAGDAARGAANKLTRTGTVVGSAAYMSPEQAQGLAVGPASDLYGLGVVAFEALTGRTPFDGRAFTAQLLAKVLEPAPSLREMCPALDVPNEVQAFVAELLERDPLRRPPSAGALIERIDSLLSRAALSPLPRAVWSGTTSPSEPLAPRGAVRTEPMLVARTIDEGWAPPRTAAALRSVPLPRRSQRRLFTAAWVVGGALVGGLWLAREQVSLDGVARLWEPGNGAAAHATASSPAAPSSASPSRVSSPTPVPAVAASAASPAVTAGVLIARAAASSNDGLPMARATAVNAADTDLADPSDEVSSAPESTPEPAAASPSAGDAARPAPPAAAETEPARAHPRRRPETSTRSGTASSPGSTARPSAATPPSSATRPSSATPPGSGSPTPPARRAPIETWALEPSSLEPAASALPPAAVTPAATPTATAATTAGAASTGSAPDVSAPAATTATESTRPATPGLVIIDPATPLAPPAFQTPGASGVATAGGVSPAGTANASTASAGTTSATPAPISAAPSDPGPEARAANMTPSRLLRRFPNVAAARAALAAGAITPLQRNRIVALLLERRRNDRADAARDYQAGRIDRSELRARLRAIELELEGP